MDNSIEITEFMSIQNPYGFCHTTSDDVKELYKKSTEHEDILRWYNARCFDFNRVRVKTGFVEASYINVGARTPLIVGSAPTPRAFDAWWDMIYSENVLNIFCLTRKIEKDRIKMDKYWPSPFRVHQYGNITVKNILQQGLRDHVTSVKLRLEKPGKIQKYVTLYLYEGWPDFGVPVSTTFVEFAIKEILKRMKGGNYKNVVHCSAGLGRSGVVATAIRCLMTGEEPSDALENLREQRAGLVQSEKQYHFICKLVSNMR